MPWFKVDDKFHDHHKSRRAGVAAVGLWTLAGSWAADNLTDGFIPQDVPVRWSPKWRTLARQLVDAGLWTEAVRGDEKGWLYHEWEERQPTRDEVESDRSEARDRMALLRAKRKAERRAELEAQIAAAEASGTPVRRKGSKRVRPNVQPNTERSSEDVLGPNPSRPVPSRPDQLSTPPAGTDAAVAAPPATTQTLVAEWIDHCGERPPGDVIGQVAKRVGTMLAEGIPYADVRRGLAAWQAKGIHPSALPSVVHEERTRSSRQRPSTTDQRVADALALRDEMRPPQPPDQPAIGA